MTQRAVKVVQVEARMLNIRDAQTVVRIADETFSERNDHKLDMIENTARQVTGIPARE